MSGYIFIYSGPGTHSGCVAATQKSLQRICGEDGQGRVITIADPNEFSSENRCLQRGNTLVVPGGYLFEIVQSFSSSATSRIENFIKSGRGKYIGICAGAYFAANLQLVETYHHVSSTSVDETGNPYIKVVDIFDAEAPQNPMKVIWWMGGAYDTPVSESEQAVACYAPEKLQQRVAVLKPRDNVFLSSIHFEFQVSGQIASIPMTETYELSNDSAAITKWAIKHLSPLINEPVRTLDSCVKIFRPLPPPLSLSQMWAIQRREAEGRARFLLTIKLHLISVESRALRESHPLHVLEIDNRPMECSP